MDAILEDASSLEPIVAWLRAGIPPGDGDGDEDRTREKKIEPSAPPPAAVTAAGFATRGAFAAAVLHTAREACAGVLRAASARLATSGGLGRLDRRSESAGDANAAAPGGSPIPKLAFSQKNRIVHRTPRDGVADIADESQFPSLGGARRRLDDANSSANSYGEGAMRRENELGKKAVEISPRERPEKSRPNATKPPKRIQPTSTKLLPDTEGPIERGNRDSADKSSSDSYERLVTPRRGAPATTSYGEGEPPATPGSAVAAPPLRRIGDFSASPGGSYGAVGSNGVSSLGSLFPASSADAEAEAAAEALFLTKAQKRRNDKKARAEDETSADDGDSKKTFSRILSSDECSVENISLPAPLVSLAALHATVIAAGLPPDLAPEVAFLCDVLATPVDVVCVSTELDESKTKRNDVVVDSGPAARRYAALVLSRSERAPHASGERALGALCASAALRRHAPAFHASLVRELGAARRRDLGVADAAESGGGGDGARGETFSSSFAAASNGSDGVDFPRARSMDAIDAAGPAPPRGGGGVAGGAGGFGGAANTEKAYRNREKSRDALYARLRALAADGGGVGSIPGGCGGAGDRPHRHPGGGGARGGRGARGGGGHYDGSMHGFAFREKSYELLNGVLPENTRWFAELFVSRLARAAAAGEQDEELGAAVNPARLSKLHKRLTGESVSGDASGVKGLDQVPTSKEPSASAPVLNVGGSTLDQERRNREDLKRAPPFGSSSRRSNAETYGQSVSSFACLFPNAQRPFVRLIESLDSHRLAQALQRALVAALHALDPAARHTSSSDDDEDDDDWVDGSDSDARGSDLEEETRGAGAEQKTHDATEADDTSFPPLTLSPGGVVPSPPERKSRHKTRTRRDDGAKRAKAVGIGIPMQGGGVAERALAARAVAGVLGVLSFGSGAGGAGATSAAALAPPPGIDPATALTRAAMTGGLLVTAPWVLAFYRFLPWDAEAATAACHLRALATLRALRESAALAPTSRRFGAPQMALRAVLAAGLSVDAPTTPAARAAFVSGPKTFDPELFAGLAAAGVAPPPPLASMPGLPPTRRDPRAYRRRGRLDSDGEELSPKEKEKEKERTEGDFATEAAFVSVDRRYLEWACPSVDSAAARLARAAAAENFSQTKALLSERVGGDATGATSLSPPPPTSTSPGLSSYAPHASYEENRRETSREKTSQPAVVTATAVSLPSTPARGQIDAPATPVSISATKTRRVVASRVETGSRTATKADAVPNAASVSTVPVSNVGKKEKEERTQKKTAGKTERALQRAFLARRPATRRVVEFVADAAALAAADAASAAAADQAAKKADAAVKTAAATAAAAAPSGCAPDDAWSPALEDAVERAAMAAARDALAPASRRAAEDAAWRAAAATESLLVPRRGGRSEESTLEAETTSAAAAAAADAARIAASDRVRRTLPFEIHARVQSAARAKLRAALAEARSAKRAPRADDDADAPALAEAAFGVSPATEIAETPSSPHASRVSSATKQLFARTSGGNNSARGFDANGARVAAASLRVALLATTGESVLDDDANDVPAEDDDDSKCLAAVAGLADALAASLFHAPPGRAADRTRECLHPERLSAREWDDAADAAASFARLASKALETKTKTSSSHSCWDAFACAFFNPATRWARHLSEYPYSPHTQRAAEVTTPSLFRRLLSELDDEKKNHEESSEVAPRAAVARAFRKALVAVAADDAVGCVGVAVALRTGAALAEVLGSSFGGGKTRGEEVKDRRETELLFFELRRICAESGERRTARRVENAAASFFEA